MTEPTSRQLYRAEDLISGFNPWDKIGYTRSYDFSIYRQFVANGGPVPSSLAVRMAQARHDAEIAHALRQFLKAVQRPLVGIMGGHSVARTHPAYKDIAVLARDLAREQFLVVTGGGLGIMEAAHLGASYDKAERPEEAIALIGAEPNAPFLDKLFDEEGQIKDDKIDAIIGARKWMKAAFDVRVKAPAILPVSLAIPTWLYGAEPTMPFATHYAKYFQNSLREEALVNNSRAGIVYGQGGGGTLREIFQDVERNYYAEELNDVTPIIFFDKQDYWTSEPIFDPPPRDRRSTSG